MVQKNLFAFCFSVENAGFFDLITGIKVIFLQKIFRIFDVNNDGTISQLEMEKLVEDMKVLLGVRLSNKSHPFT